MKDKARKGTVVTAVSKAQERPAPRRACLVCIHGADLGKKHDLDAQSVVIGRSSKTDIQVDQDSVSRNHSRILHAGKSYILRDLGSTNGTYVNDELIDEYVLRDGDLVRIGRTIFKFLSGENIETAYHEEIYRLTTIDGLTQVMSRRTFVETLEREISRAQRYHRELSLVFFDVDHFKLINDGAGHLAGDHVLRQLAQTVKARIRREDTLARYGGEEFAVLLPEIDAVNAKQFAEKIRKLIEKSAFKFESHTIPVTVSVGVASLGAGARDSAALLKLADDRLYEAKNAGRNRVVG